MQLVAKVIVQAEGMREPVIRVLLHGSCSKEEDLVRHAVWNSRPAYHRRCMIVGPVLKRLSYHRSCNLHFDCRRSTRGGDVSSGMRVCWRTASESQ